LGGIRKLLLKLVALGVEVTLEELLDKEALSKGTFEDEEEDEMDSLLLLWLSVVDRNEAF